MALIRFEMDRGNGWELRQEGHADLGTDQVADQLPAYCSNYAHRVLIDGNVVAEVKKPRYLKSKVVRY